MVFLKEPPSVTPLGTNRRGISKAAQEPGTVVPGDELLSKQLPCQANLVHSKRMAYADTPKGADATVPEEGEPRRS